VAVNAMVAVHLEASEQGERITAAEAARRVWGRRRDLAGGFLRGFAIVYVLLITVVGVPWGIRQLVRYQLLPQAVMLEGLDAKRGLARSSELVTGRWWHTALLLGVLGGLVAASGLVFGLLVLVAFAGLPMWLFSALVTLIYALVVPLTSVAQAMLYGDAVAEREGAAEAEPVPA
jgi:hypothetical protein